MLHIFDHDDVSAPQLSPPDEATRADGSIDHCEITEEKQLTHLFEAKQIRHDLHPEGTRPAAWDGVASTGNNSSMYLDRMSEGVFRDACIVYIRTSAHLSATTLKGMSVCIVFAVSSRGLSRRSCVWRLSADV